MGAVGKKGRAGCSRKVIWTCRCDAEQQGCRRAQSTEMFESDLNLILSPLSKCELLSRVRLFATPWTVARKVPLSIAFSR